MTEDIMALPHLICIEYLGFQRPRANCAAAE